MNRRKLGLKKPEGIIHGTLTEQNILYAALENTPLFRKNDELARFYNDTEWFEEINFMYADRGESAIDMENAIIYDGQIIEGRM